jgi:hypothetical protein
MTLLGVPATLAPEGSRYDLVADLPMRGLKRNQVKTGTGLHHGSYICSVSRSEYDLTGSGGKRHATYSSEEIDYFACVTGDLSLYLIPIAAVEGQRTLYLRKYTGYRVRTLYDGQLW